MLEWKVSFGSDFGTNLISATAGVRNALFYAQYEPHEETRTSNLACSPDSLISTTSRRPCRCFAIVGARKRGRLLIRHDELLSMFQDLDV